MAGLFVWVFGGALFGGGIWVFRDAGHFYYPLYQFTGEQLAAGSPALWNPYENLGVPLAANPTSALFYPPTWIFALPIGPAWAWRLYVLGHVGLAFGASYALARRWKASPAAAMAAALSYAFCGNVLYQVCNVVFLVGAAWTPLALGAADRMLRTRSLSAAIVFGVAMAAMTLGGDPQAAYHVGLLAVLYALVLWRWQRGGERVASSQKPGYGGESTGQASRSEVGNSRARLVRKAVRVRPVLLGVAAGVAFCLAAVQVMPSMGFTRISSRRSSDVPRSIHELLLDERSGEELAPSRHWSDGLLHRRVDRAMHHSHVYHFSVGPWRLVEYVWPNVMGRQFPVHHRWADAIPSEGRLWVPSLYMGIVPLLLALGAMRFRSGSSRTVWLSWAAVLCIVGSLGWFGLGWVLREVWATAGGDYQSLPVGPPVGGLYWLMTVLLPGYVYFRYPAKLLTVAAVALSMLTAMGWDQVFQGATPRFRRNVRLLGWLSLAGTVAAIGLWWFAPTVFRNVPANVMFGPLDSRGAAGDILLAFAQTTAVVFLFSRLSSGAKGQTPWRQGAVLALIAVDLGSANAWMVPTADAELWRQPNWLAERVEAAARADGAVSPVRIYRQPAWLPPGWQQVDSAERLEAVLHWDQATGSPKHNLAPRYGVAEVYGTMIPHDYQVFLWYIKHRGGGTIPFASDLAAVGVGYEVLSSEQLPAADWIGGAGQGGRASLSAPAATSLWKTRKAMPRAWLAAEVEVLPPLESGDWRTLWRRTAEIFHPDGTLRDLQREAVVEATAEQLAAAGVMMSKETVPAPQDAVCRIVSYEPTRVEIDVEATAPSLVVLADQFSPGWQAEVETAGQGTRRAAILRTNRVMRGVWVEQGKHKLVFRYRPVSVFWGALLSVVGWSVVAGWGIMALRTRQADEKIYQLDA